MIRRVAIALAAVCALGAVAAGAGLLHFHAWSEQPLHQDDAPRTIEIPRGTSVQGIAARLEAEGLLEYPLYLRIQARLQGIAARLQSGEYAVPAGMTPPELLERMARGQVIQHRFTLVEGRTFKQLRAALEANPKITNTLIGKDDGVVMEALGAPDLHPEGRFLPETYSFARGTRDVDILRRALHAMQAELEKAWSDRRDDLPLEGPEDALILASIIERETGAPEERARVAGVFIRRLEKGMRLQTDPTVIYGMGDAYDGRIRTRDLRTDTPYNTYTRHGLPPTPIAMPGTASLRAAVNPEPGEALYFVSRGDGTHVFSRTLEEHNRAVRRYILGEDE